MRDCLVYIAGPLTLGFLAANVRRACAAGLALIQAGVPVVVPHLSVYLGQDVRDGAALPDLNPGGVGHEDWYAVSLAQVRRCDAVLRLPGESVGADLETAEARRLGKPVFGSVAEVLAWAEAEGLS